MFEFLHAAPNWVHASLSLLLFLGLLGLWLSMARPDKYELPEEYSVQNVEVGQLYTIPNGASLQTFEVLEIRGNSFRIQVLPSQEEGGMHPVRERVSGWTTLIPTNRFIIQSGLRQMPEDAGAPVFI